jgi:hypothetical protein
MKSFSGWMAFVLLLGAILGFLAGRTDSGQAAAQGVDNKTTRWLAGTVSYGQAQECFLLFDAQTNRLMAYNITPMKELELLAVREVSYDVKMSSWGKQKPAAADPRRVGEVREGRAGAQGEGEVDRTPVTVDRRPWTVNRYCALALLGRLSRGPFTRRP